MHSGFQIIEAAHYYFYYYYYYYYYYCPCQAIPPVGAQCCPRQSTVASQRVTQHVASQRCLRNNYIIPVENIFWRSAGGDVHSPRGATIACGTPQSIGGHYVRICMYVCIYVAMGSQAPKPGHSTPKPGCGAFKPRRAEEEVVYPTYPCAGAAICNASRALI